MIMDQLGIYGWKEQDENLVMASLLTGDPLLLIGNHGCAKTLVANKVAQALGGRFLVYDASKAMFEDVLGYPNVKKLKQGVMQVERIVAETRLILIMDVEKVCELFDKGWQFFSNSLPYNVHVDVKVCMDKPVACTDHSGP